MPESAPADTAPEQPRVFLLSLAQTSWYDEMYERLIDKLSVHARLQRASKPAGAIKYLSSNNPTTILAEGPSSSAANSAASSPRMISTASSVRSLTCPGNSATTTAPLSTSTSKLHLHGAYSQKAVHLKNVEPTAALYLPLRDSTTESHVFPRCAGDREQTPVAFTAFDQGWVGYVGDVNTEEGSDEVILAMCGL
ncbi:hypothetical protein VTN00DRAFT_7508 [Thermoascus crustaceus]|uniref:uncharacterized protein n=1 Tax=Thermoascus crustaceus TaxID=5088 RepID=UPI003743B19D